MAVLVRSGEIPWELKQQVKNELLLVLMDIVRSGTRQDLVYRALEPEDLGSAHSRLWNPNMPADTWTHAYTGRLSGVQAVGIYEYVTMTGHPFLDGLRFEAGPGVLAELPLHTLYAAHPEGAPLRDRKHRPWPDRIGFISDPLIWQPNEAVVVSLKSFVPMPGGMEAFGLNGYVVEQAGLRVMPPRILSPRQIGLGGNPALRVGP
jgi:hypothetical protein